MNKIYCNKDTDMVEQIINVDIDKNYDENWFKNCYMIDDPYNEISTYNIKFNKKTKRFEVVEGLKEKDKVEIDLSNNEKIEVLEKENIDLKTRLEKLESALLTLNN